MQDVKSAYIHIPFCVKICTYCDFNKYFIQHQPVDDYLTSLITEMSWVGKRSLSTMFVGGGTPTALSEIQLERLLIAIQEQFDISGEYTFEANPDELTEAKVALLKKYGVNRLSLGVQTFDEALLKVLGRSHQRKDIYTAVTNARKYGILSISIDLMYQLPGQTMAQFEESLDEAISLNVDHISSYGLILEKQTQFYNLYQRGKLNEPDEDLGAEMYHHMIEKLAAHGLHQYEISNFAKVGHASAHNKVYWKNEPYFGFGAGASGYVGGVRYSNINPVQHYIEQISQNKKPIRIEEALTTQEKIEEEMFLGLRMNEGVSKEVFYEKYGIQLADYYHDELQQLERKQLIHETATHIALTDEGRVIGNYVFETFIK
ncbi:oxygen-independent coproporphyrinogen III oxidase [Staphylococcus muscae]|uniref:Heme chaperone HemW n=1 Tax=Staphylococcus muscae TaxID=1294 RepID=A0A240C3B5_9STAP|nr:radical SAM family heme chaperone HemW [Staphylococcus muscae]AVQ33046.1 oxygen-independent coproporphyrinogen III oxidase [Staphylococcus muscae]PNZ05587.1 coproporphyrinogen III oxidase [Staphylococcus muscae]GGA88812.1 coproporphyrinogen III oxidase [Staphylococcus muscae]SNW02420.1 oxygen-independent coproporphyrinogen III oxidase [Staphylococcus muscae]